MGSLNALSMIFADGTIFHVGIIPESFVRMVVTKAGGFTFSEIWNKISHKSGDTILQSVHVRPWIRSALYKREDVISR